MAYLSGADYAILILFLLFSAAVGVYHALRGDRQRSAQQYLLANRNMHPIPVAISLVVSVLSAVTYLGTPAEVYVHGPQYWVVLLNKIFPVYIVVFSFCPLFYRLKVTSIYEYLDMRFGKVVRYTGVTINFVYLILYMGIVVFAPALALNAVTGISLVGSILAVGIVCTFYTTIGGITAVVWTDVFQQSIIMLAGFLVTIIACCVDVGGLKRVFQINIEHGRGTFFDFRPNPTIRHSFWSVFIGLGVLMTSYVGTNQIIVQRYMTCRTLRQSQFSAGLGTFVMGFVELLAVFSGMCLYAYFAGCDPLTTGKIQSADQLMAYVMVDLFQKTPGVAGFLISAAFSASLSTVSSGVNALATLTGQDIIRNFYPDMSDFKFTLILKFASIFYGVLCICVAFLVSALGGILPLTISLIGILNGPILGVFCLGIYFPWCNTKGAVSGMIFAVAFAFWLKIGSIIYPPYLDDPPLYVDQCPVLIENVTELVTIGIAETTLWSQNTITESPTETYSGIAKLYSFSYAYYTPLTCFLTIIVGLLVSFMTGGNGGSIVDPKLISPWANSFCCCLPRSWRLTLNGGIETDVTGKGKYVPVDLEMDENCNDMQGKGRTKSI
ncbi:Sodium-coupled monocarboxylate transporter 1 [Holothuria leucospilota]|uniref:Sodium-coupled monocarboxylate transporter 1 n=1 Tax=Holothuria leucospilota TaxID=206669 RepID=A0A9Q0YEC2_HOLLE|nr:Sodium-coupled monocarboxylate transporter 1 [Holothuria leucospilota]